MTQGTSHSDLMHRGVAEALDCHRICEQTISYCLEQGGRHAEAPHIRLLTDCADICRLAADFMVRGSEFHQRLCGLCAEICLRCAEDCERFGDDAQMRQCAETCRRCAETCGQMAGATA